MVRPAALPVLSRRRTWFGAVLMLATAVALVAGSTGVSLAQDMLTFPARPKPAAKPQRPGAQDQMLVRAEEINYDYTNERVSAVGIALVLLLFFIGLSNDIGRLGN